jgi:hypothetical protein
MGIAGLWCAIAMAIGYAFTNPCVQLKRAIKIDLDKWIVCGR